MQFGSYYDSRRVPLFASNVVATSQPLAAQAGLSMLSLGGNAIDAALAAAIALTVVEPTGCGIGSDAFAIVHDGSALHGLNSSGRSPAGWTAERFAGAGSMPATGWDSVTVPGAVAAWVALSDRFGRLPFQDLFAPAIRYAAQGFAVTPTIAAGWASGAGTLQGESGFAAHFMPNGRPPAPGEIYRNPDLASTLEAIASSHGRALYEGQLGEAIAADASAHGATLTLEDLAAHRADWCGTIATPFAGTHLHEIPPNGQGIAALMALGILRHTAIADHAPDSPEAMHLQIEAMKLAFADTDRFVSDPDHMQVSVEDLIGDDYAARRAGLIGPAAGDPGAGAPRAGGTVYVTAADDAGRMISFIQSNYAGFGSGVVVPGTGIHLQNRGAGFTLEEGHPNRVGPAKRPFHTIIPGFVTKDGAPHMSFGVMGGPMQAQGHVQMMVRMMLHDQNPQMASDAPRWRVVEGRRVAVEWSMPDCTVAALTALGHDVVRESPDNAFGFGGAQLIARHGPGYVAGSDHRKDGCAAGY